MTPFITRCNKLISDSGKFALDRSRRHLDGLQIAFTSKPDTDAVVDMVRGWPVMGGHDWLILAGKNREAQIAVNAIYARNFISRSIHCSRNPLVRIERQLLPRPHRYPMYLSHDMVGAHYWSKRNPSASRRLLKAVQKLWLRASGDQLQGRYCPISPDSLKFSPMFPPLKNWEDCGSFIALLESDESLPHLLELWRAYHAEQRIKSAQHAPKGAIAGRLYGTLGLMRLVAPAFYLRQWSLVRELVVELEERYALAGEHKPSELRFFKSPIHVVRALARYVDAQMDPEKAGAHFDECLTQLELYLKTLKRAEYLGTQEIAPCVLLPAAMLLRLGCPEDQFPFLSTIRLFPEILAFDPEAYAKAKALAEGRDLIKVDWDMVVDELRRQPFKPGTEPSVSSPEWVRKQFAKAGVPFPLDEKS